MSKPKWFEKPSGFQDYLPNTVARLRKIEDRVMARMRSWGYEEIITPALEYYDTVGVASSTSDSKLFKLLDKKGTTMVLRSDATAPIARVVSSLLKNQPLPIRLAYHVNVFRAMEEEAGRQAEFFQTGVELVGDDSPEADAEIIALAIDCLQLAGIPQFKIAIGHIGFLHGLFEETLQHQPEVQKKLKHDLLNRNHVGYKQRVESLDLHPQQKKRLIELLRLRGRRDVCEQASFLSQEPRARAAIEQLCEVWDALEDYGVSDYVVVDLAMVGDLSYYTGMTFEGYTDAIGFPLCSGGRYDNLLKQFGRPAPATGFALKTNRILELTAKTKSLPVTKRIQIVYTKERRKEAIAKAASLRKASQDEHVMVILCLQGTESAEDCFDEQIKMVEG